MKMNRLYAAAMLLALVSSCQKEDTVSQESAGKRFQVVTNVLSRTSQQFDTSKNFILTIDQTGNDYDYKNMKMKYDADNSSWIPEGQEDLEWIDAQASPVTAVYIPGSEYTSFDTSASCSGDVSNQQNADVLYFKEDITDKASQLAINFRHLLCMIELPEPDGMPDGVTISTVQIKGVKTRYTWTPESGPESLDVNDNMAADQASGDGETSSSDINFLPIDGSFRCILPPQALSNIQLFITYSNDKTQTERFNAAGVNIEYGCKYRINNFTYQPAEASQSVNVYSRSVNKGLTLQKN